MVNVYSESGSRCSCRLPIGVKHDPYEEESMVGFVILGIVMLIWVMTWDTTGSEA